ncbi:hypothetical protein GBAR_LOCUS3388 [Geodia barretti]|uniref:Uncharacterized protein n=1 Tax=Geodia barretti TaxID=519541 RepID=A0AA35R4Y0_GEOBA|nr:hypothetical protein GBAR_LOCUS3388 [Geodia barretti]
MVNTFWLQPTWLQRRGEVVAYRRQASVFPTTASQEAEYQQCLGPIHRAYPTTREAPTTGGPYAYQTILLNMFTARREFCRQAMDKKKALRTSHVFMSTHWLCTHNQHPSIFITN